MYGAFIVLQEMFVQMGIVETSLQLSRSLPHGMIPVQRSADPVYRVLSLYIRFQSKLPTNRLSIFSIPMGFKRNMPYRFFLSNIN